MMMKFTCNTGELNQGINSALLAVSLPPDWRNKGEQSARKLRELHCRALAELPSDPAST